MELGRTTVAPFVVQGDNTLTVQLCPFRDVLGRAHPRSQRERANIERKFAEQKQYHGLRQARYWGLRRVTIQVLMTCLVVNCKRMVRLGEARCAPPRPALCLADAMGR